MDKKYEVDFSRISSDLGAENSTLKIELYGLHQVIENLENQLIQLEKENERLHQKLTEKYTKGA